MEKHNFYFNFLQDIDELLYLYDWLPKKLYQKIDENIDDENKLLNMTFTKYEAMKIGNACIRYELAIFPSAHNHVAPRDLEFCKGRIRPYNFTGDKLTLIDIDEQLYKHISSAYDLMMYKKK